MAFSVDRKSTVPFFVLRLDGNSIDTIPASTIDTNIKADSNITTSTEIQSTTTVTSSLHRTKALFTVPEDLATALIIHPILCCGSLFHLLLDDVVVSKISPTQQQLPTNSINISDPNNRRSTTHQTPSSTTTSFIYTTFDSIDPDSTAYEISLRIAVRLQNLRNTILEIQGQQQQQNTNGETQMSSHEATIIATRQLKDWAKVLL